MQADCETFLLASMRSRSRIRSEVRLEVIGSCNYRCFYCYNSFLEAKGPFGLLSIDQAVELGRVFTECELQHVHLTGGEPSLRADLDSIVTALRTNGVQDVAITSNGSNLKRNNVFRLINAGLCELHLHLPSLSKKEYGEVTKSTCDPAQIAQLGVWVARQGLPLRFNVPVCQVNADLVSEILDFAFLNGINVGLIKIEPEPGSRTKLGGLDYNEIKKLLFDWALQKGHEILEDLEYPDFGDAYVVASKLHVQLLNTSRTHDPSIDNRIWVGANNEGFLFSESLDLPAIEANVTQLRGLIQRKYLAYFQGAKAESGQPTRVPA